MILSDALTATLFFRLDACLYIIMYYIRIQKAWIPGMCIGTIVGVALILIYMPSTIQTIGQLRCGIIPTFKDRNFGAYRKYTESVFYNLSNMIYAMIGSM
jgi:hypothetical protein